MEANGQFHNEAALPTAKETQMANYCEAGWAVLDAVDNTKIS
jgi:hypothetical protein